MTREEILTMNPGRELDALVATEILELIVDTQLWLEFETVDSDFKPLKRYSTDIAAAWDLTQKFNYVYLFRSAEMFNGHFECKLTRKDEKEFYVIAPTAPEAICKAALLAVMKEE